jgi:hypothetical protein
MPLWSTVRSGKDGERRGGSVLADLQEWRGQPHRRGTCPSCWTSACCMGRTRVGAEGRRSEHSDLVHSVVLNGSVWLPAVAGREREGQTDVSHFPRIMAICC